MELTRNERQQVSPAARLMRGLRSLVAQQEFSIIVLFFVMLLFFYSRNSAMLNPLTIFSVLRTMAFPGLVGMGMVQLMIAGEIDLSTGAMMSLAAVFSAVLVKNIFVPAGLSNTSAIVLAVVCTLGVAVLVGLFNSFVVVRVGVPAVIVTIGSQFIVRGISYSFTNGLPIYPLPPEAAIIGSWKPLNISFTFFLMLGLCVVVHLLLTRSRWGAALFATGSNKVAAQVCGINTDRVKTLCFIMVSVLAAMAGLLTMSSLPLTPGDPIIGRNLELPILVGVVIGGVSFFGGRGSAIGTLFGVMFMQLVQTGIVVGHFNSYLQAPALGFMLLLAAVVDVIRYIRRV